jgi:hypothetical protein
MCMLVVDRSRVGVVAFSRLQREGLVHCTFGAWALPTDILSTRAVRAHVLAPLVPAHAWVTGLSALWLEGCCGPPPVIDLVTARGAHRTEPKVGSPPLVFHTGKLWGTDPAAHWPRRTTLTRACLDALAHSPAATALPAVASGIRLGMTSVAELRAALNALDPRAAHGGRVKSLIEALGCL